MHDTIHYPSPLGDILLAADDLGITGLWFAGQKHFAASLPPDPRQEETPLLRQARQWLDLYFSGRDPGFSVPVHIAGTPFQEAVWELLRAVPYGSTVTYGQLAAMIARQQGLSHMSAQAVGGAVGRNRVSILIPCHRVLGSKGQLTGYAGGPERKAALLRLENILP